MLLLPAALGDVSVDHSDDCADGDLLLRLCVRSVGAGDCFGLERLLPIQLEPAIQQPPTRFSHFGRDARINARVHLEAAGDEHAFEGLARIWKWFRAGLDI